MARQRIIKPEIWTDENFVKLSAMARLLFIGLWNFADDKGVIKNSPLELKMKIFPADNVDCAPLIDEIANLEMVVLFESDGVNWIWIHKFLKHQKIDRPQPSKNPQPPVKDNSTTIRRQFVEDSLLREEKRREEKLKEVNTPPPPSGECVPEPAPEKPAVPRKEIIAIYNETCSSALPRVEKMTEARKRAIDARWKDLKTLEAVRAYFERVMRSTFLVGLAGQWRADFDWLLKESNYVKVTEGKYDNRGSPARAAPSNVIQHPKSTPEVSNGQAKHQTLRDLYPGYVP